MQVNITESTRHNNSTTDHKPEQSLPHNFNLRSKRNAKNAPSGASGAINTITNAASTIAEIDKISWKLTLDKAALDLSLKRSYLEKYMPSQFRTGVLSNTFALVGNGLSALTGIRATGEALRYDLKNNDKQFSHTMKTICKSVAKTSAVFAAGTLAAGATATITTSVIIPAVIGVGLSIATGYLLEQGLAIIGRSKITFTT